MPESLEGVKGAPEAHTWEAAAMSEHLHRERATVATRYVRIPR